MTSVALDRPGEVRGEDGFDVAAVDAWLQQHVDLEGAPDVKQFAGGASNLTFLLSYPGRDLILRRPPGGQIPKSGHDMRREFHVQQKLAVVYPYVPKMVAFCDDHAVIGGDFYVMERIRGVVLRDEPPAGFPLDPAGLTKLCANVVDRLADLHAVDAEAAGLGDLGRGSGYVERQVSGWSKRYRAARTRNVPSFEKVIAWLEENKPPDAGTCVIHNDWRLDNLILDADDPSEIIAVLDWEMATLGDPLMELGAAMAYWVQADDDRMHRSFRRQPTHLPGMYTREQFARRYSENAGIAIDNWAFYEVFGLFRYAAIAQQIHYRLRHKETSNPAFKRFWLLVRYLHWRARRVMAGA
ncbi:MAG: phosphotransferase family protein [Solirubrobacterales bacterium]